MTQSQGAGKNPVFSLSGDKYASFHCSNWLSQIHPCFGLIAKIPIHLAALNPDALQLIERALLDKTLGHGRMFFNLEQAIEAYQVRQQEMINE